MKHVLKSATLCVMLFFMLTAVAQPREGITANNNFMNIHMLTKHLDLTDDQVAAIKAIMDAQKDEIRAVRTAGGDREAQLEAVRKIKQETETQILALLTPEQLAKYNELLEKKKTRGNLTASPTANGGGLLGMLDRQLDLNEEQEAAIKEILENQRNEISTLRRSSSNLNADRDAIRAEVERIRGETETAIKALLTPEQLVTYNEILDRRKLRGGGKVLNPNDIGGKKMQGKVSPGKKGKLKSAN